MSEDKVAVSAFIDRDTHLVLRTIAENEGRSLTKQVTFILTRFAQAQTDDGA